MAKEKISSPDTSADIFDFIEIFVITLASILLIFSFFVRQTVVDGGSMDNTLNNGERLLVSDLGYTPKAGDVIVFQSPETGRDYPLVKRVIATAGQTVEIREYGIAVDGVLLTEDYVFIDVFSYSYHSALFPNGKVFQVPEGKIFVLGDHRNNSADSRSFGFIDERTVIGRVLFRVSPLSRFGVVE